MSARPAIWVLIAVAFAAALVAWVATPHVRARLASRALSAPPVSSPAACASEDRSAWRMTAVVLGDSITRGAMGHDFLADVRARLPEGYMLINAGVNGARAADARARLDAVVACRPDAVAILIGTNDVLWGAAGDVGLEAYRRDLDAIVTELAARTTARLAVISVPLIGENLDSNLNARATRYAAEAREIAERAGARYLPLRERQEDLLRAAGPSGPPCAERDEIDAEIQWAFRRRHARWTRDWDAVAADRGFRLVVDCVHLSRAGARPAAELLEEFLLAAP
jgi:lysophospholipase L1-like esterase